MSEENNLEFESKVREFIKTSALGEIDIKAYSEAYDMFTVFHNYSENIVLMNALAKSILNADVVVENDLVAAKIAEAKEILNRYLSSQNIEISSSMKK